MTELMESYEPVKARMKRLTTLIHDPAQCEECNGTGRVPSNRRGHKYGDCLRCLFGSRRVMVSVADYRWLLKRAGVDV